MNQLRVTAGVLGVVVALVVAGLFALNAPRDRNLDLSAAATSEPPEPTAGADSGITDTVDPEPEPSPTGSTSEARGSTEGGGGEAGGSSGSASGTDEEIGATQSSTTYLTAWESLEACEETDLSTWVAATLGVDPQLVPTTATGVGDAIPLLRELLDEAACATIVTSEDVHGWELRAGDGGLLARAAALNHAPNGGVLDDATDREAYEQALLASGQPFFGDMGPQRLEGAVLIDETSSRFVAETDGLVSAFEAMHPARRAAFRVITQAAPITPALIPLPAGWEACTAEYYDPGTPWGSTTVVEACRDDERLRVYAITLEPESGPVTTPPSGGVARGNIVVAPVGPVDSDLNGFVDAVLADIGAGPTS